MESNINLALDLLLEDSVAGAVFTDTGEVLSLKHETIADFGCLPTVTKVVSKYFSPRPGEVILTNDPFSGGHIFSFFYLFTCLTDQIFLVSKLGFKPRWGITFTKGNEGIRVPPTPVSQDYQINMQIIEAITSHELAPKGMTEKLVSIIHQVWDKEKKLKNLIKQAPDLFSKKQIEAFLKQSSATYRNKWIDKLEPADQKLEINMASGEKLRVRVEITPSKMCHVDFSGTSESRGMNLTTAAVEGCCYAALSAFTNSRPWMIDSLIKSVQISSPTGSFLHAKANSPTATGMLLGTQIIADGVLYCLTKLAHRKNWVPNTHQPIMINLNFGDKEYFEQIPGGVCATADSPGVSAHPFWIKSTLANSVQLNEQLYPLKIVKEKTRESSKTGFKGGKGLVKEYILTQDATLSWILPHPKFVGVDFKSENQEKSKIFIKSKDQTTELSDEVGELKLKSGDTITCLSGGF
jgi:N-methylhydantoinase B/oxoprolinase/acetone carboxylase alpha subunit